VDVVFTHGAGLDVQKKTVRACRVTPDPTGQQADGLMEVKECSTLTSDLLRLSDWRAEVAVTPVAMESTGEYWRPISTRLEGTFTVFLVNAAQVKQVPGRKTDKADARWLAKLLRYGWLAASCIPAQGQRDWRELTRYRTTLVQERSRAGNRVQGVLARANIQLASVATAILGVSGRAILAALRAGRADAGPMAEWAKGRMRTTSPLVAQALTGLMRDHQRRLLTFQLAPSDCLDEPSEALGTEIMRVLTELGTGVLPRPPTDEAQVPGEQGGAVALDAPDRPLPFAHAVTVWASRPGVAQRGAELFVAAWGPDMSRVGTASRLAAWSGVAPGNDESAGKRRSGKTRQGHRTLRTGLTPRAHAAARTKGTSLSALYQRLATRRGRKRAIMAVAHASVVSAFPRLSRHERYRALGANSFDEQRRHHLGDRLTRRLQRFGSHVHLEPVQTV
jgi:transposase